MEPVREREEKRQKERLNDTQKSKTWCSLLHLA
jgi:hypothetical protein